MKPISIIISGLIAMALASSCTDLSGLTSRVDDIELRVQKLEEICKGINSDVESLQTIVAALEDNDYITSVTPTSDGYQLVFKKYGVVNIRNGQDGTDGQDGKDGVDGQDGSTPIISVALDPDDGNYYWTLNGEWLLDADGNRIRANGKDGADGKDGVDGKDGQDGRDGGEGGLNGRDGKDGKDGKDGITPQIKIEDGKWYVSTDNGVTWTYLGEATSDASSLQAGSLIIRNIFCYDTYCIITLNNGEGTEESKIMIPIAGGMLFRIVEEDGTPVENQSSFFVSDGTEYVIHYQFSCYIDETNENSYVVDAIATNGWDCECSGTYGFGTITVTPPVCGKDDRELSSKVWIYVSDGLVTNKVVILHLEQGKVIVQNDIVEVPANGGEFEVKVTSNDTYTFETADWIHLKETKSFDTKTYVFTADDINSTEYDVRQGMVFITASGKTTYMIYVNQEKGQNYESYGSVTVRDDIVSTGLYETHPHYVAQAEILRTNLKIKNLFGTNHPDYSKFTHKSGSSNSDLILNIDNVTDVKLVQDCYTGILDAYGDEYIVSRSDYGTIKIIDDVIVFSDSSLVVKSEHTEALYGELTIALNGASLTDAGWFIRNWGGSPADVDMEYNPSEGTYTAKNVSTTIGLFSLFRGYRQYGGTITLGNDSKVLSTEVFFKYTSGEFLGTGTFDIVYNEQTNKIKFTKK